MRWLAGMGLGCKNSPSQRESGVECGTGGLWMLLREEERACQSGRQVAGMRVAGDLACVCPWQLGQAATPCLCFPYLTFPHPRLLLFFPNCFLPPSPFYLAFPSSLRHIRSRTVAVTVVGPS